MAEAKKEEKKEAKKEEVKEEKAAAPAAEAPKIEEAAPAVEVPKAEALPTVAPVAPAAAPAATSALNGAFPDELNHWNWGAFFLSWIWAIGNSTWIGLLALISPIGLIVAIVLGIKGNEWAWQHRKFESVDQFKAVQKAWATWGLILFIIGIVLSIIAATSTTILGLKAVKNIDTNFNINTSVETPAE